MTTELNQPLQSLILPEEPPKKRRKGRKARQLHAGDLCPACQLGNLDYDGLLNLTCPTCGYALGGCFT